MEGNHGEAHTGPRRRLAIDQGTGLTRLWKCGAGLLAASGVALGLAACTQALLSGPAGQLSTVHSPLPLPSGKPDALQAKVNQAWSRLPLTFIENRGQADPQVSFYVQGRDTDIYFTREGVTFGLTEPADPSKSTERAKAEPPATQERWVVKLDFLDGSPKARLTGEEGNGAVVSYFIGDRADWRIGVPTFTSVSYRDLWPGIDLVYSGKENRLKYTFLIEPGADPGRIRLAYRGTTGVRITEEGNLAVSTPVRGFEDERPYAYQEIGGERIEVPAEYELEPGGGAEVHRYGFRLGPYDPTKPLVLDPVLLTYTGYIGGSSTESANSIAVDDSGNAYVAGWTNSTQTSFPETVGPDTTFNTNRDAFVAKVAADGTGLVYCGYIGGNSNDFADSIAVDGSGNAYVAGGTQSTQTSFPETNGPDLTYNGSQDGFVAKVRFDGSALDYCGYIGSSGTDTALVAVDSSGNAYVTGRSGAADLPVTVGPAFSGGNNDAYVGKLDATGSWVYLRFLGGSIDETGRGIAVHAGNAYVVGDTWSSGDFPVAVGPSLTFGGGSTDAFVAKVSVDGTTLDYCGYLGGAQVETGSGIDVDASGNAYVSGTTASTETDGFPLIVGPDLTYNGGTRDAFVAKVKADGTGLDYSGYIGGSGHEVVAQNIAVDDSGNAYTVGYTNSTEASFPVLRGPDLTFNGGSWDAYVAKVKADGSGLSYGGYLGGSGNDFGNGIDVDGSGTAYVAGETFSRNTDPVPFPVHVGPDVTFNGAAGDSDAFVAKIEDTGGTAVELTAFTATGYEDAVRIEWQTASELDNLGFHVYRAAGEQGPYQRITPALIPGLGSSPEGARYQYLDSGLADGQTVFYKLEDVDTTGTSTLHGPVPGTPLAGARTAETSASLTYGESPSVSMKVVERSSRGMVLELRTSGFLAEPLQDGSVRLSVPGLWNEPEPGSLALPVWRSWLEVPAGRKARIASVRPEEIQSFSSLRPSAGESAEIVATRRGVVRLEEARRRSHRSNGARFDRQWTRVKSEGYQGDVKRALVEISPFLWDAEREALVLARRITVELSFSGRDAGARSSTHGRYARRNRSHRQDTLLARLSVRERGLYALRFEDLVGALRRPSVSSSMRLSYQGRSVPFHLEPEENGFGPGSTLTFFSQGAALNPYGHEAVYELSAGPGVRMAVESTPAGGAPVSFHWKRLLREENRYYQAALLEAPDLWLWDVLLAPVKKSYSFELTALAPSSGSRDRARLEIWLQGASESSSSPDHHLRFSVNGSWLAETSFAGKKPEKVTAEVPLELLRNGMNQLDIENVGDTGAPYSMVMLDRFEILYPRYWRAEGGLWEGSARESGTAELSGLEEGAVVLDVTDPAPRWLEVAGLPSGVRFPIEAGRSYLASNRSSVPGPEIEPPIVSDLKSNLRQADYVIIGPEAFLAGAQPLLDSRRKQGLHSVWVPLEEIYSEFGFGEPRPQAVKEFLSYAYHHWRRPALRYVLLLGDGTYDFKDYLGTGVKNQVPPWMVRTSFLWTASDAGYAAVNGEDSLPDLAIGRLPAASLEEVRLMVEKILAYEASETVSEGPAVLVADNPDSAGDFAAHAEELAGGLLASRNPEKIYLERLGTEATRAAIVNAFDRGASLLSYIGHGGIQLWAEENLFDNSRVGLLAPRPKQPVVLTLNCLNGYFLFPYFDSLSEELVKAEGRGAIAAVSPSGLSLDDPAHLFHLALVRELLSAENPRIGDAFLAAQSDYAAAGAFPELLDIYHLLGDPALRLRERPREKPR